MFSHERLQPRFNRSTALRLPFLFLNLRLERLLKDLHKPADILKSVIHRYRRNPNDARFPLIADDAVAFQRSADILHQVFLKQDAKLCTAEPRV